MSDRTKVLESLDRLKAEHRTLAVQIRAAVKSSQWAKVAALANLLKANVTARKWRREKLKNWP
jgi:hypothetical protein